MRLLGRLASPFREEKWKFSSRLNNGTNPGCLGYIGRGIILPSDVGIITNHYN